MAEHVEVGLWTCDHGSHKMDHLNPIHLSKFSYLQPNPALCHG